MHETQVFLHFDMRPHRHPRPHHPALAIVAYASAVWLEPGKCCQRRASAHCIQPAPTHPPPAPAAFGVASGMHTTTLTYYG